MNEELQYLADQEAHHRGTLQPDDCGEQRASLVREWALRTSMESVEALTGGPEHLSKFGGEDVTWFRCVPSRRDT